MRDGLLEEGYYEDHSEVLAAGPFVIEGILVPEVFRMVLGSLHKIIKTIVNSNDFCF